MQPLQPSRARESCELTRPTPAGNPEDLEGGGGARAMSMQQGTEEVLQTVKTSYTRAVWLSSDA